MTPPLVCASLKARSNGHFLTCPARYHHSFRWSCRYVYFVMSKFALLYRWRFRWVSIIWVRSWPALKPMGNDDYIKQCLLFVAHSPAAATSCDQNTNRWHANTAWAQKLIICCMVLSMGNSESAHSCTGGFLPGICESVCCPTHFVVITKHSCEAYLVAFPFIIIVITC